MGTIIHQWFSKLRCRSHVSIWILIGIIWFASLGVRALISPDEGRYAMLSLQMLQSGDWITPRLNGILYFEKPALQYWAGALSFSLFGINDFAARFWPGFTGFLAVIAVGCTGNLLWGRKHPGTGHLAALIMAGSVWIVGNSHFLTLDMGLTFFLTIVLCAFVYAQRDEASAGQTRNAMWLAWVAMAGATLSKGLIGILIPGCALVLYSLINWHWAPWKKMHWASGLAILLVLSVPWFWLVSERNPGFAHFFFIHEHFERFLTTEHRREGPLWYFVPILFAGFLPWTALLPRLARDAWQARDGQSFRIERFLLIWAVFVFAFFSKSGSKLPSYILPMFPALALLLAQSLTRISPVALKKYFYLPVALWLLVLAFVPFANRFGSSNTPGDVVQHFAVYLGVAAFVFLTCAALAFRWMNAAQLEPAQQGIAQLEKAIMALALGSVLSVVIGSAGHDEYGKLKSSKRLVESVQSYLKPGMPIYSVRTYDQTFPFYLGHPITLVDYVDEFEFGQKAEPGISLPTLEAFVVRWQAAPSAMAMLGNESYVALLQQKLPMKVVYQDPRRVVVVKP